MGSVPVSRLEGDAGSCLHGLAPDSVEQWLPSATRDNEAERRREAAHDLFGRGSSRVSGQQVEIKVDVRNSRAVDVVSADDAHRSLQRGIHYSVEPGEADEEGPQTLHRGGCQSNLHDPPMLSDGAKDDSYEERLKMAPVADMCSALGSSPTMCSLSGRSPLWGPYSASSPDTTH